MTGQAHAQTGAALLLALLVMALVAALGSGAYWYQWQAWQQESQMRAQRQSQWLMAGAMDWARHILREDVRANSTDHLAEPWALPLRDVQLSSVMALATTATEQLPEAALSGRIEDAQARLNLRNLMASNAGAGMGQNTVSAPDLQTAQRLFAWLELPQAELDAFIASLQQLWAAAGTPATPAPGAPRPAISLLPQRFDQLTWLGLSSSTLASLAPYATWLPQRTPLNLNTCSAAVLHSALPALSLGQAQQALLDRDSRHFDSLDDARTRLGLRDTPLEPARFAVSSRHFLVQGRLQMEQHVHEEIALMSRTGTTIRTLWRIRPSAMQLLPK
jgi:general secretion pathway protein K